MGDFNIDLSNISSPTCHEYVTCLTSYGFSSLVETPTRVTDHSSTIIDHVLSNTSLCTSSFVLDAAITDHYPVAFVLSNCFKPKQKCFLKTSFDWDLFVNAVRSIDWTPVLELRCPNESYDRFSELYAEAVGTASKSFYVTSKYKVPRDPWITYSLLCSQKTKETAI